MRVDFLTAEGISNPRNIYGILRYTVEIAKKQKEYGIQLNEVQYSQPPLRALSYLFLLFLYPFIILFSLKSKVVHLSSHTHAFLLLLPIFGGRKTIVTVYDIYPYREMHRYSVFNRMITTLNMAGLKKADKLVAISEFTKRELISKLGIPAERISIAYPAVDHRFFKPASLKNRRILLKAFPNLGKHVILYLGSEEPRQNLETLLQALQILKNRGVRFQFVKVGMPSWPGGREKFLNDLEKYGLSSQTLLLDYVREKYMPALYSYASVMAYPCKYTGFGLPPLEAMACGCPVVTSNATSIPEVVGNGGLMFSPADPKGFASALEKLLRNPSIRKKFSKKALKRSQQFSWKDSSAAFAHSYKQMV